MAKKNPLPWVSTIYFAQGLPFSLVRQMAVIFFKDQGVSLSALGLVSLYGIPWTFKFLWSPILDALATKRKWILAMESALVVLVGLVFSFVFWGKGGLFVGDDVKVDMAFVQIISVILFLIAIVSATHDIAIDGFYLENFDKEDRAKYSGWGPMGNRLAYLTGGGLLMGIAGPLGWATSFGLGFLIFLFLLVWHSRILPKQSVEAKATEQKPQFKQIKETYVLGIKAFFKLPGVGMALAFILLFKVGDALLFGMSSVFLREAGMSKQELGFYSGMLGMVASVGASLTGGWLISKFGLKKMLWIFAFIQNLAIPIYAWAAYNSVSVPWLAASLVAEQIAAGLGGAAYSNFLMRQIDPQFRATHFAISTSLMSFTTMACGAVSGYAAAHWGFGNFFMFAFVASLPGMLLVPFVARRPECQK